MRLIRDMEELRGELSAARRAGRRVGLIPTMGALHEGHLSLVRRARSECDLVVVSIFVNPRQFGPREDLDAYPRDEPRDRRLASDSGADVLFVPSVAQMYPSGFATTVSVGRYTDGLCAAQRSRSHFDGVATVVTKLLNLVGPDVAYFGQKDAQQAVVIRRLVADLNMATEITVCPTVREADGLALSSRNRYLTGQDRIRARALRRGLDAAERAVQAGETDAARIEAVVRATMSELGVAPEYVELVDPETLAPATAIERPVLVAVAAQVGPARLIDNTVIRVPASRPGSDPGPSRNPQIGAVQACSV